MISIIPIISRLFNPDVYKRLYKRFLSLFVKLPFTPDPILIMTLLVKNEEDILEENLIFHKAMGVDGFIVTDNNSTDNTLSILEKYVEKGWVKKIIIEKGENHKQEDWVHRMILLARDDYKADWIINADADEFWYTPKKNLKKEFFNVNANIVVCPMMCVVPEDGIKNWKWTYVVKNTVKVAENYSLSKYSIFCPQIPKIAHRTFGYKYIYPGNHWANMFPEKVTKKSDILIYHYTIRGFEHYMRKIINGGKALEKNSDKSVGDHWRYLYQLYLKGKLVDEYRKIIGTDCREQLLKDNIIEKDTTIYNFMNNLYK